MSAIRKFIPQGQTSRRRGSERRARTEAPDARRGRTRRRWLVAAAMCAGLLFSGNAWMQTANGAVDIIRCSSGYTLDKYNKTKEKIEARKKLFYVYNLGIISLCLGKEAEGMANLQRASDSGHIAATHLLGVYLEQMDLLTGQK